jgi:hypothetical protein
VQKSLSVVLKKFPGHEDEIKRLFRVNETFQSLCDDYRRCAEASQYWHQSTSEEAPARREEYGDLLQDLLEEILQTLKEST